MASWNMTSPPPLFVMETPKMLFRAADMPFWVWLVVAGGALLVIIIIVFIIILLCLCRSPNNHFWCCCFGDDEATTTIVDGEQSSEFAYGDRGKRSQILYRYPADDLGTSSDHTANNDYVPRAQRLTSGRNARISDNGFARSAIGSHVSSSHLDRPNGPVITEYIDVDEPVNAHQSRGALVGISIGKPASIAGGGPRPASVIGQHSASVQIGGNGNAAVATTSIWPAL